MNSIYDNYGKNFNKLKSSGCTGYEILKMLKPAPKKTETDKEKAEYRLSLLKKSNN